MQASTICNVQYNVIRDWVNLFTSRVMTTHLIRTERGSLSNLIYVKHMTFICLNDFFYLTVFVKEIYLDSFC